MKRLFVIFAVAVGLSCSSNKGDQDLSQLEFILQDSIVVDYIGNLRVTDFSEQLDSYLAIDGNTIIQFKENGAINYNFSISSEGPEGIRHRIDGLSFFNDTSLLVQSARSLYFYNFRGNLIEKVVIDDDPSVRTNLKYKIAHLNDLIITLMIADSVYKHNQKRFYEVSKILTVFDLDEKLLDRKVPYEKESIHRNGSYFTYSAIVFFHLNESDNLLYVIKNPDPTVYVYDPMKDFELVKKMQVYPQHFNEPIKIPYGAEPQELKSLAYDGLFNNIFSEGKYTVVEYLSGLPLDSDVPSSLADLNSKIIRDNRLYYSVFKNGKKWGSDLLVPEGKFGLVYLNREGVGLFQLDKRIDERNYEVFYKYKFSHSN